MIQDIHDFERLDRWVNGDIPDDEWVTPDFSPEELKQLERSITDALDRRFKKKRSHE